MESSQQFFYTREEISADFPGNRENTFEIAEKYINQLLDANSCIIDDAVVKHVKHYLHHNENEMAFELLVLEVIEHSKAVIWDSEKVLKCALFLELDKESVYDDNFFEKLVKYLFLTSIVK